MQIIGVFFSGLFYDLIGRKITIILFLTLCAISSFLSPYPAPEIYPFYFMCKCGVTISAYAFFSNPLLNDYITVDSRPRTISLELLTVKIIGIFSSGVYYRYMSTLEFKIQFSALSAICIGSGIFLVFLIKEPRNSELLEKSIRDSNREHIKWPLNEKFLFIFKFTFQCLRENPALLIGLICNIVSTMQNN